MAKLALAKDFLGQMGRLSQPAQSKITQIAETFRQLTAAELRVHKGINLEPYSGAADPRARTIRIDLNHRGVVLDAGNELFILTLIATHDVVDRWMMNNTFKINQATGALEILNTVEIEQAVGETEPPDAGAELAYSHRRDRDFVNLGIDEALVPVIRAFTSEDQVLGLASVLPRSQADALLALHGDETVEKIYQNIAGDAVVQTDDVETALDNPASQAQFAVVASEDELQEALAKPLAHWRTYLHPSQRSAAYRETYNGPARITGGAGTGKTIVAIHRAALLARRHQSAIGRPVLFTTFTKNLAKVIERELQELAGADAMGNIDVVNVDALAYRIVRDAEDARPVIAFSNEVESIIESVIDERGLDRFSVGFVVNEWEQVILAQACASRSDYFTASRAGRGVRLERRQRAEVWKVIEDLTRMLTDRGKRTYLQLAAAAEGHLAGRAVKPYEHVVVDEAQDLHEAQWRLLRAAVDEHPDDMFIVGDSHQRIYDRRSSLSKVGINIVGRSKKLRINYRTTHEILRFGLAVLGDGEFDDLDTGTDAADLAGYHSYLHGGDPTLSGQNSAQAQLSNLIEQIQQWVDGGIPLEAIAVCARVSSPLTAVAAALERHGLESVVIGGDVVSGDGIRLGTMHRLKGLEFQCVAIVDCDDDSMPSHSAVTAESEDAVQRRQDLQRERCLLYVACTRARDGLWVGWSGRPSRFLPEQST
jgi:superfamily I DNA/RNA helicase